MEDLNKSKIIITNIGFEIGYDEEGIYNLSDSLSYIIASKEEYELFKSFTTSLCSVANQKLLVLPG